MPHSRARLTETAQEAADSPGVPKMRSRPTEAKPALRAAATAPAACSGRCCLPRAASTPGSKDWAPSDTRLNPASTRASASRADQSSGLASRDTSAPGARPNRSAMAWRIDASAPAVSCEGVPPPTKTASRGAGKGSAVRISASSAPV